MEQENNHLLNSEEEVVEEVGEVVEETTEEIVEETNKKTKKNIQKINKDKCNSSASPKRKFSKEQFLKSKSYSTKKDLINALLKDEDTYSEEEVNQIINTYLKGEI